MIIITFFYYYLIVLSSHYILTKSISLTKLYNRQLKYILYNKNGTINLDEKKEIEKCQKQLYLLHYDCKVNGIFNSNMEECVKAFQNRNDLNVTGIIDNKTYNTLFSNSSIPADPSRMAEGSKEKLITFDAIPKSYKQIIKSEDISFFNNKLNDPEYPEYKDMENFEFILKKYTGNDYHYLNDYLKYGNITTKFSEDELKSWTYCLHYSLTKQSDVQDGSVVYRGVKYSIPEDWVVGKEFYFAEFVSTSLKKNVAKDFSNNGTILYITIKNNKNNSYCRNVEKLSHYIDEREVLITAYSHFKITKIEKNIVHLDCEGYDKGFRKYPSYNIKIFICSSIMLTLILNYF